MFEIIKNNNRVKNPFLLFFPFLIFYIFIVLLFPTNGNTGDESKYINLATNLVHGFYSSPAPNVYLGEGPGYPILLMPFIGLRLPLISITFLNAVFYYISIILLYKSLLKVTSNRLLATGAGVFWGCYYNIYEFIPSILTESLVVLLITLILYLLVRVFESEHSNKKLKYILLAGFFLGYLALTKLIFGYVVLVLLTGTILISVINKMAANFRKILIILSVAFATICPYLIYTYHLTGRFFYLGTSGGNNLYWMSSPVEREYGSWFAGPVPEGERPQSPKFENQILSKQRDYKIPGFEDSLKIHHQKNFDEINKYTGVEKDDAFKRIAIKNIKSNPIKFLKNCFANIGRIFFNYPYSYELQKPGTLIRFPLPAVVLVLIFYSLIPTFLNWKKIIFPIRFILFFVLIYLGGSILASAEIRMFTIIIPAILLWLAYILEKTLKVKLRFDEN
jgi:4-amino-4-deoxy-L-arabinose transferase-like glycosyltransferase